VNAQLLQSLSGYENEKPAGFPQDDRPARNWEMDEGETGRRQKTAESTVKVPEAAIFVRKYMGNRPQS
jgi:hypothetical protein